MTLNTSLPTLIVGKQDRRVGIWNDNFNFRRMNFPGLRFWRMNFPGLRIIGRYLKEVAQYLSTHIDRG
jgi:hypothetical protein